VEGYVDSLPPQAHGMLDQVLSCAAIGSPGAVAAGIRAFAEKTGADELMLTSNLYAHAARRHSYEIVAGLIEAP
jgi:alkanesulfonate monooxygenase SsuD/methylene tetrahydromethanopterin reductase-like flavin-dependent oxidoreductase (luciferase family)